MSVLSLEQLLLVEESSVVPPKVLVHSPQSDVHEGLSVFEEVEKRLTERPLQLLRLRPFKRISGAVVEPIEVPHRVAKTAHCVNHRHGAIVHGIELIESAGLEARGHEQDISGCRETMSHLIAEPDPRANLIVVALLHVVHSVLEVLATGTEKHHLNVLVHEETLGVEHEVHALLLVEAADEAEETRVGILRQTELALECCFASLLPGPQPLRISSTPFKSDSPTLLHASR